jgi:hypothetical protein
MQRTNAGARNLSLQLAALKISRLKEPAPGCPVVKIQFTLRIIAACHTGMMSRYIPDENAMTAHCPRVNQDTNLEGNHSVNLVSYYSQP